MSDRTQAQRPRRAWINGKIDGEMHLPPWSDLPALIAEVQWLRSWTRHLEQQNERLRRCRHCR